MDEKTQKWAEPNATMCLIFAVFAGCFWAMMTGQVKPEASLIVGVIQISVLPSYLVLSTILLKNNDGLNGNLFSYFCVFFSAVGGATSLVSYFANIYGWPIDASILGLVWLYIGLMVGFALPAFKTAPWSFFVLLVLTAVGLVLMGLITIGLLPASLTNLTGWIFGLCSMMGLYFAITMHVSFAGVTYPLGKPFFKE